MEEYARKTKALRDDHGKRDDQAHAETDQEWLRYGDTAARTCSQANKQFPDSFISLG